VFEIGHDQGEAALDLAREAGFRAASLKRDLGGRDRAVLVKAASFD
jgi:methylase of polypeptide subunit release factors